MTLISLLQRVLFGFDTVILVYGLIWLPHALGFAKDTFVDRL
jgi:hypothetical protein